MNEKETVMVRQPRAILPWLLRLALLVFLVPPAVGLAAPRDERSARVIVSTETPRSVLQAARIQRLKTLDKAPIYELSLRFDRSARELPDDLLIEYEIRTSSGTAAGGGSFTLDRARRAIEGEIRVLTGFGGIKLSPDHLLLVRLVEAESWLSAAPPATGIVDTCTLYCEKCAGFAQSLCSSGMVEEFDCSCEGESRSCRFKCKQTV